MLQQAMVGITPTRKRKSPERKLREAMAVYVDLDKLRLLANSAPNCLAESLKQSEAETPSEAIAMLMAIRAVLTPTERTQIKEPSQIAALLMADMGHLDQEELRVILLSTKMRVVKIETLYRGTVNTANVRVAEIFKEAVRQNCPQIIVCHNHPSGDPTPSPEDVLVTRNIVDAGSILEIDVLDHVIIGRGKWVSLKERGLGFSKK